jgi:hypothetical protein
MHNRQAEVCTLISVVMMSVAAPAIDRWQPTRTNPLVFNFFRQQILESNLHQDAYGKATADFDTGLLDTFASSLARDFCLRIDERIGDLEQGFRQVQSARSEALRDSGRARQGAQAEWSKSLRHVANTARKLHGMLRLILAGVRHEVPDLPEASTRESDSGFEYETKMLGEQILRLDQRIKNFLSGETFTVSVEELRNDDIMMLLSRVQAEAGGMEAQLDAAMSLSEQGSKGTGN